MADGISPGKAKHQAKKASDNWVETLARAGYAMKGVVYGLVGVLALQAALGQGGSTEGSRGAIREIAQQPFGQVLLVLVAIGLAGYAIWRFVQAVKDPDGKGDDASGYFQRFFYVLSGLAYVLLAYSAARTALGAGGGGGGQEDAWTARLMEQPLGRWLVGIVGLVVIGVGLYHFVRVHKASFMDYYHTERMSGDQKTWARRVGRFGLAARGVTFCLIGGFFIQAALQADPSEAAGLDGALQTLAGQPYGPWLLGVVAAGLVAYGVHCFVGARYRKIDTE